MQEQLDGAEVLAIARGDHVAKRPSGRPVTRFVGRDNTKYGKRHVPGQMNKTEESYAELLAARVAAGEVLAWWFEGVTFKLAQSARYTPDFAVQLADGSMEFVDCKGGGPMDDKSIVKIKVAAQTFPLFKFVIEKRLPKKDGGGWKRTEY